MTPSRAQGLPACNGWTFWHFERDGEKICIDDLRGQYREIAKTSAEARAFPVGAKTRDRASHPSDVNADDRAHPACVLQRRRRLAARKKDRMARRSFKTSIGFVVQAAAAALFARRCPAMPRPAKPTSIIAQVDSSGTAVGTVNKPKVRRSDLAVVGTLPN